MNTIGSAEAAKREPGDWSRDKTMPSLSLGDSADSRGSLAEIAAITSKITSLAHKTQPRNNGTYRVQHALNMQLPSPGRDPLAPWRGHMANLTHWQARSTIARSSFYPIYVMDQYVWRPEVYLVSLGGPLSHHEVSAPVSYHGVYDVRRRITVNLVESKFVRHVWFFTFGTVTHPSQSLHEAVNIRIDSRTPRRKQLHEHSKGVCQSCILGGVRDGGGWVGHQELPLVADVGEPGEVTEYVEEVAQGLATGASGLLSTSCESYDSNCHPKSSLRTRRGAIISDLVGEFIVNETGDHKVTASSNTI
ncbi:hypothetical protein EDB84DRAFT_1617853 [Lactarius hengduanensis]|nr:hypothetical protein EDB84DRAFT_1617853 [Lactarius hengduanensis]